MSDKSDRRSAVKKVEKGEEKAEGEGFEEERGESVGRVEGVKGVEDVKERILGLLKQVYPLDLSIKEIARRLSVSRVTVSKYVAVLEAEGRVECRVVGRAKLYRLKL
jgi:DNA-binding transcriptional ArsR family regulator